MRLRLQRADRRRRLLDEAIRGGDFYGGHEHWFDALGDLREAEKLVSPADAPARFRRVAEAWLAVWQRAEALPLPPEAAARPTASPDLRRYATYLRRLIEDLPAIATGGDPGGGSPER